MGGSDLALGAQWMWGLDDVTLNFKQLQVKFNCLRSHLNYHLKGSLIMASSYRMDPSLSVSGPIDILIIY